LFLFWGFFPRSPPPPVHRSVQLLVSVPLALAASSCPVCLTTHTSFLSSSKVWLAGSRDGLRQQQRLLLAAATMLVMRGTQLQARFTTGGGGDVWGRGEERYTGGGGVHAAAAAVAYLIQQATPQQVGHCYMPWYRFGGVTAVYYCWRGGELPVLLGGGRPCLSGRYSHTICSR
jgi:hypothetical protein